MGFDEKLVDWTQMRDLVVSLRELLKLEPSDPENLNEALGNILTVARNLFPPSQPGDHSPDICTFSIFNPFNEQHIQSLFLKGERNEYKEIKNEVPLEPIVKATVESGELFIETLLEHPELRDSLSLAEDIQSIAAVAFYTRKKHRKPLGVLCLGFKTPHKFASDKKQFLRMLAHEGSAILQSIWLLKRYNDVATIGREINEQFADTKALFQKIAKHIPDIINVSHCFMLAVRQRQADRMDVYVLDEGKEVTLRDRPLVGGSGRVIQTNVSLSITHASEQPDIASQLVQLPGTNPLPSESLIFVPLSFRGQVLGVLSVQHRTPNKFDDDDVHILEVLSYHISLAISTQFLYQSLDSLNITGRRLLQQLDSDQLLQSLADEIKVSSGADLVDFYPYLRNEHRFDLPPRASGQFIRPDFARPSFSRPDDISALTLAQQEAVFARDSRALYQNLGGDPRNRQGNFEEREAIVSTAAVPLRVGDEEVGVLFVNFRTEQNFDAAQKRLIENLGHYAAIAIKNSRVFADENKRRAEMLVALRRIDREISRTLDLKTVLKTILDLAIGYISNMKPSFADSDRIPIDGAILLYNDNTGLLEAKATAGPKAQLRHNKAVSLIDDEGITSFAFKNNQPVRVKDVSKDPMFKKLYYLVDTDTRCELDVPLSDGNDAIGVINLESTYIDAFSEIAEQFLVNVAERAVLAIKNAQIFEAVQRSKQELQTIRSVERQIVNRQITTKVFQTILDGALLITGAKAGHIVLRDEQKGDLYVAADKNAPAERRGERITEDQGIIGWVMTNKTAANADITSPDWREIYRETIPGMRYELTVPIGLRESETSRNVTDIYGVINLEKPGEAAFTDDDINSLVQFANQALVTLQKSQESDRARVSEAKLSALREIDLRIIGTTTSLDDVMQLIISSAMELTQADVGNLHIYEGERPTVTYSAERDDSGKIVVKGRIDEEQVGHLPARRGIVAHVAETMKTYRTVGDAQSDPYFKGADDVHSNIAVPMLDASDRIGVLNLESKMSNAFGSEEESLLEAIASQAIIAILKVRGDSYAADSLKRFKLLSSAAQELLRVSGPRGIHDSYKIIVDKVHDYLPCNVAIWSYDEEKELLHCEIEKAVTDTGRRYAHDPLKKSQGVNGYVAENLKPIVISDAANLQLGQPIPVLSNPNTRSIAIYPILIRDENDKTAYYGNLSLTHERPHYFKPDYSELFVGLTQQLALTIQRLRVGKERVKAQQQAAKADLRRDFAAFEKLAFGHAHSLGNLLGPIASYLRRVRKALHDQPTILSLVNRDLDQIGTQVEAVLERQRGFYARATGLSDPEAPVIVPVSALIAKAQREFPPLPDDIKLAIIDTSEDAEVRIVVDRVIEILFNLVTNAIEAMPTGGKITLTARVEHPSVQLLVQDTGGGVDPEIIDQIFGMHFTTKPKGTGFGLWSSRIDARKEGGELTVKSELGQGSIFVLTLPLNAAVK